MSYRKILLTALAAMTLSGAAMPLLAQNALVDTVLAAQQQDSWRQQREYCRSTGGIVQTREAVYGTNGPPSTWLRLASVKQFCQYVAADTSTINVELSTLNATRPTLAALAYYAQVPWNGQGNGNPASFYCTQLGGAEIGATSFAGGAWVSKTGDIQQLEACVFPDESTIDSWGLLYHANNIVRGIDLSTVLKYKSPY